MAPPRPIASAPEPPAAATRIFASRLPAARRYADLLCTVGVERGLIGPREPGRIWSRHLLNGAALAPLVPPSVSVLDLGSGAGLPGIPLTLARPDLRMTLLEPMARRAAFLAEIVAELALPVGVARRRAEECDLAVDVVVARAVAPLARLLPLALPLLRAGGVLLALKGTQAQAELDDARAALRDARVSHAVVSRLEAGGEPTYVISVTIARGDEPS